MVASTSGNTADRLFELAKGEKLRIIVVTHDEGKPESQRRFSLDIRRKLLANNILRCIPIIRDIFSCAR